MRRLNYLRPLLLSIATVSLAFGYSPFFSRAGSSPDDNYRSAVSTRSASGFSRTESRQAYIVQVKDDRSECRTAGPDEAALFTRQIPESSLHVISPSHKGLRPEAVTGLQIVLRGTNQLHQFPQANAAFLRAAANGEAVIATPISIVIDVDFGPNDFGTPFPKDVLGATDPQVVSGGTIYSAVKNFLIADAPNPTDLALYNGLPTGNVPTDLGSTPRVSAPAATFRASGLLPSVADPAGDAAANLGDPPQVGFNSNFQFTFDPTGGIAANTFDFDAVATHEIGHVLGFHSSVGETELKPPFPLSVSLLDIFRFRPGTVTSTAGSVTPSATLGSANRIESSGGDQVFFFGAPELALSTGRPDGNGGDGNQASHWKSAEITGTVIGIMDPSIAP